MTKFLRFLPLLSILCLQTFLLFAQPPSDKIRSAGKDFWVTVRGGSTIANEFYISSAHHANVTFTFSENGTSSTYSVQPGEILKVPLSQPTMSLINSIPIEVVLSKSLHITSDSNIVVQFTTWGSANDDGSLIYPSDKQQYGNVYYLNGMPVLFPLYPPILGNRAGGFSIVATCDSVSLEIIPSRTTATHPANIPFMLQLNKGQTYVLANSDANAVRDLSGTKIEVKNALCCNPINIYYTAQLQCSFWPFATAYQSAADGFFEQVLPVSVWDTIHYIVPSLNSPYNIIKVVSSENNNAISFNDLPVTVLGEAGTLDTIISEPLIIHSSSPVSITQYMVSQVTNFPNANGGLPSFIATDSFTDPNAGRVQPLRDGVRDAYFQTVGQSYLNFSFLELHNMLHVLTLISRAENINTITLNGVSIANYFQPFPSDATFMYAEIRPDTGTVYHLVSGQKIVAYYYAAGFCATLDFHLGDVSSSVLYNELPTDTIIACVEEAIWLDAGAGTTFNWSTGATTQQISVTDTGLYYVIKENDDGCVGLLKKYIIVRPPTTIHEFDLGPDTTVCEGYSVTIKGPGQHTQWSTGYIGESITVDQPGIYWATLEDTCLAYSITDTIRVNDTICLGLYCNLFFPNAFSPNNDGQNDFFLPAYYGAFSTYALSVYNRWGERIFSSFDINNGWNGMIKGVPGDMGTYYFYCTYYCPLKGHINVKGDLTLIR